MGANESSRQASSKEPSLDNQLGDDGNFNNYLSVKSRSMQAIEHVFVSASGSLRGLHRFFAFSLNTILPSNVKFKFEMKLTMNYYIKIIESQ